MLSNPDLCLSNSGVGGKKAILFLTGSEYLYIKLFLDISLGLPEVNRVEFPSIILVHGVSHNRFAYVALGDLYE